MLDHDNLSINMDKKPPQGLIKIVLKSREWSPRGRAMFGRGPEAGSGQVS